LLFAVTVVHTYTASVMNIAVWDLAYE
jgi:hypothetical protein